MRNVYSTWKSKLYTVANKGKSKASYHLNIIMLRNTLTFQKRTV